LTTFDIHHAFGLAMMHLDVKQQSSGQEDRDRQELTVHASTDGA
jgi:hypothetical protein